MGIDSAQALSCQLRRTILDSGAAAAGIADISRFFATPRDGAVSAIVFGVEYPRAEVGMLPDDAALMTAIRGLSERIGGIYGSISAMIREEAPSAQCCRVDGAESVFGKPHHLLSQKAMGVLAGLGWIGKPSLLVSPDYGPRIRIGTILTDAPLVADEPYNSSHCGSCRICKVACPSGAVTGEEVTFEGFLGYRIDRGLCVDHLSRDEASIGRRHFCGLCLKECPWPCSSRMLCLG